MVVLLVSCAALVAGPAGAQAPSPTPGPPAAPPAQPAQPAPAEAQAAAQAPLPVGAQSPEPGKLILERRPVIAVTLGDPGAVDPKTLVLEVDGMDVTMLARIEGPKITYVPPADLVHGERTVRLSASSPAGQPYQPAEWKFKIRRFAIFEDASLSGELSSTYEYAARKPRKEPEDNSGVSLKTETPLHNLQSNLAVRGLLKEGELQATLDSNVRYVDEFRPRARPKSDTEKLDIANYLIGVKRDPGLFELGDVTISEGFFGAPSLSRRGMHLKIDQLQNWGFGAHGFATRYETTTGHDPFFGPEESDSYLVGGALIVAPFKDRELLKLHGLNVRGHRFSTAPGSNVGTIVAGERGDLWSFGTSTTTLEGRLNLQTEIAFSEFDQNVTDEDRDEADKAWRGKLEYTHPWGVVLEAPVTTKGSVEYSYVGFSFRSPANPGIQPDREGYQLRADSLWKIVSLNLGYSSFNDNTDRLEILPRVRTNTWTATLGLTPQDWPSPTLTYTRATQRSFYQPEDHGEKRVDNVQSTYGLNLTYSFLEGWSANWGGSLTVFDEKRFIFATTTGGDTYTWTTQAGLTMKPMKTLTITPGFNYTLLDERKRQVVLVDGSQVHTRVRNETVTGTLQVAQELIANHLNLDLQISGASTQSNGASVDQQIYTGVGRLTWNLGKLFWDYGKQAVSLRVNLNRVVDHVIPRDQNEIGVFVILDLLAPYNL